MRTRRLLAGLVLLAALVPGTYVRSPQPVYSLKGGIHFHPLDVAGLSAGPFVLERAWQIDGEPLGLGGLSALAALGDGRFVAGSDGGLRLEFSDPDRGDPAPRLKGFGPPMTLDKFVRDLESLTRDPETGRLWAGYEMTNSIARFGPGLEMEARAQPAELADWGENSGAEALARFADGRFLVIEEQEIEWDGGRHRAVLYASDPTQGAKGRKLTVQGIAGYRPVDMQPLDSGRAVVLFRDLRWGIPPGFATAIGILDLDIRDSDGSITVRELARLPETFPLDNYEGMALTEEDGRRYLWLVSDDNFMRHQRTLLLKLRWTEAAEKAARERQKARR